MLRILFFCLPFLLFSACQTEPEGILEESQLLSKGFIKDLKKIHSRADALQSSAKIRKHYRKFAALMIEAKRLDKEAADMLYYTEPHNISEELQFELRRIYQIQGVRSVLDECQKEALYDLYLSSVINES